MHWPWSFKQRKLMDRLSFLLSGFLVGIMIGMLIGYWIERPAPEVEVPNLEQVKGEQTGQRVVIERVIDGDTVVLAAGEQVRLLGIDAPEKDEPCFTQARDRLIEMVKGQSLTLTHDSEETDIYNRQLGWLWAGVTNVNLALVDEGLARASLNQDMLLADELIAAERSARQRNFGCIWSSAAKDRDENLEEISYTAARERVGNTVSVAGQIDNVQRSGQGNIFINFCADYSQCPYSAVILSTDSHRFDELPDNTWAGRTVRITGKLEEYQRGQAETVIIDPEQLEIIY